MFKKGTLLAALRNLSFIWLKAGRVYILSNHTILPQIINFHIFLVFVQFPFILQFTNYHTLVARDIWYESHCAGPPYISLEYVFYDGHFNL